LLVGVRVEKLERILHAEDSARTVTEDARDAASSAISEARAKAAESLRLGREDIRVAAAARTDATVEDARRDAGALATEAGEQSRRVVQDAEARMDDALAAVLRVLRER
jgi:vacuolar-type H+-ATPase subunit H